MQILVLAMGLICAPIISRASGGVGYEIKPFGLIGTRTALNIGFLSESRHHSTSGDNNNTNTVWQEELLLRIKKLLELRNKLQQHYLSLAGSSGMPDPNGVPDVDQIEDYFVIKARKAVEVHLSDFDFNVEELCKELILEY